jgi:hypothetical protein
MQAAIDQFRSNIARVRDIGGLHHSISNMTTPALDLSDLLRTQIVMCVSALDHYVHEVTRLGMLKCLSGSRTRTPAFLRYDVSIANALQAAAPGTTTTDWLDEEIRIRHGFISFQTPDKIADAVRLISPIPLWNSLAASLNTTSDHLKKQLQLIIDRRNKIVHEADIDPTYPGSGARWPITAAMVNDSVDFIETLCEALHPLL